MIKDSGQACVQGAASSCFSLRSYRSGRT